MATTTPTRDLLGLQGMEREHLTHLLRTCRAMARVPGAHARALAGKVVANLFFEDSTRTRLSFTVAAQRLGADVVDLSGHTSSVSKGETLIDTATNIEAMGVSALVVRAKQSGAAALIADHVAIPVLNAGDGRHEHPTQGLLDIYTIAESLGRLDSWDFSGLRVAIVGDVASSRVARSDIAGLTTLGASVVCVGSPSLAPGGLTSLATEGRCVVARELDPLLPTLDAIIMLRIQFERSSSADGHMGASANAPPGSLPPKAAGSNVIASVRDYRDQFALTAARAETLKPGAVVLHPGPINRGIELDAEVADGPRSVILRQVTHGVTVRMAMLKELVGGGGS
jgi:aspartate carbamoyltransferase catalytic subunit